VNDRVIGLLDSKEKIIMELHRESKSTPQSQCHNVIKCVPIFKLHILQKIGNNAVIRDPTQTALNVDRRRSSNTNSSSTRGQVETAA